MLNSICPIWFQRLLQLIQWFNGVENWLYILNTDFREKARASKRLVGDFGLSYKVLAKINIQIQLIENEIFQGK